MAKYKERRTQLPQYESNKTERMSHIDQSVIDFALNHVWIGRGQVKPPSVRVIMGKNSSHCFLLKQSLLYGGVTICYWNIASHDEVTGTRVRVKCTGQLVTTDRNYCNHDRIKDIC